MGLADISITAALPSVWVSPKPLSAGKVISPKVCPVGLQKFELETFGPPVRYTPNC